ncbi:MAG TPA: Asp-tRNA(Asn)/Glu-tRNA(Gln) amidotransferase subunit GatC [Gemmatimonadaceae bacterium]|nr:Asp-tRNA(Asn)/Glu-tRNA(Gln) amidotransferase subunit GatC [Gemmatimonadaceae bacterium]
MSVTHDDVKHIADLARMSVSPERLDPLVNELNGILAHMEELEKVDTREIERVAEAAGADGIDSTPMRSDSSGPLLLLAPRESFAPAMRDGFFLVPRLATHEDAGDRSP